MKILWLALFIVFLNSNSLPMNTIFLKPTLFVDTIIESQITKIKGKNKVNDNAKEKKIVVKTYKPEENQDDSEWEVIINEEIDTEIQTPEINNQESENEDLILDSNEYEDIVFKDIFDNEYWWEN